MADAMLSLTPVLTCAMTSPARRTLGETVRGVLYMHSHGIMHRDLTISNLLLSDGGHVVSDNAPLMTS